jgi:hypothetical protein
MLGGGAPARPVRLSDNEVALPERPFPDKPKAIAEAVRALRATAGRRDRDLLRILRERPTLQFLSSQFEAEFAAL